VKISPATAVALVVGAAALLRLAFLDSQSFWYDEAVVVRLLERDFGSMLDGVYDGESTPPLYYVLAWLWSKVFGTGEVGLRLLSALAGTAFVYVVYLAGRRLLSHRAGLIAAGLAAVNPLLVYYSQEARAYGLLMLFGGLSLLAFLAASEEPTRRALGGWALASALAMSSHYYAAFLVAAEAGWLLAVHRRRAAPAVAGLTAVALALLPLALHQRGLDHASFLRESPLAERLARLPKQLLVGFEGPAETVVAVAAGLLALAGVGLALGGGRRERRVALGMGSLAVTAVALPIAIDPDTFGTRNALAAWLPGFLVLAAGFAAQRRERLGGALAAALAGVSLITTLTVNVDPARGRDDWRGAAEALGPPPPGGRFVVVSPEVGRVPLGVYLPGLEPVPPGGVAVREAVSVAVDPGGPADAREPPRPARLLAVPSMRLVRRVYAPGYSVLVYRSRAPVALGPEQGPLLDLARPADRLFQRP